MPPLRNAALPILVATVWISVSEFLRNEALFKSYWTDHFSALGLDFPDATPNNLTWGLWALAIAVLLRVLQSRFSLIETIALGWFTGFWLMWIVIGNLGVLPWALLPIALPWSLLEVAVATWILHRMSMRGAR